MRWLLRNGWVCGETNLWRDFGGSLRSRRYEVLDGRVRSMPKRKRGSRRNPKWLKCRDCGYEPKVKMVRRDCKECGGFMRVLR